MKAEMQINKDQGYVAMAAFIVHTTAKMLNHIKNTRGNESRREDIHDQTGSIVGHWSLTK